MFLPLFDRLMGEILCQVGQPIRVGDLSYYTSELEGERKRGPASGVENEPVLPSD